MKRLFFVLTLAFLVTACNVSPSILDETPLDTAGHDEDPHTKNLHAMGHDLDPASLFDPADNDIHTDLAFWGKYAFQGNWDGFRVLDISAPGNPKLVSRAFCDGNQGDVVVWEDVLVRSWNSPAGTGATCGGQPVPQGFEGLHVFDISDIHAPTLVGSVQTECGSHTATGVPDPANNRLLIYNSGAGGSCPWFEIVEVPLDDPGSASIITTVPVLNGDCHDIGVILGDVNLAGCASDGEANVFDIGANAFTGGSLTSPQLLYTVKESDAMGNEVGVGGGWHSAAFTWDGKVLILGWEPGGGGAPECEASDPDIKKSAFFYDAATGAKLGQWTLPRPQTALENCTIHNYNVVPVRSGRYVLVHGSYQSGTSVVDFTDPANAVEVGYSDPPPIVPTDLGGAWSTYWYNNFMVESNITEGLNVFRLSSKVTAGAMRLPHLNPQTQEFSLNSKR